MLLHEGLGSIAMWRDFPQRLAATTGAGVLAYSRYGYGRSAPLERPREPSFMHDEAETLREVIAAAGLDRPVLVGHSDGGSIALIFAVRHPDATRGLVVLAPHVMVEEISVASIALVRERYATTDLRARLSRYHDDVDGAFRGWNEIWLDPRFRAWDIRGELPSIRVPVLALQGAHDEYGTRAQIDAIAAAVPSAEVELLSGCGHSPHRDRPEEVLARIAAFLNRL